MRVFKSVIIIVVVAGWGCTLSPKCAPGRPSAVVLWVKRIHNYRLRTLNLTATKGTSCSLTFWLLQHRPKGRWLEHAEMRKGFFSFCVWHVWIKEHFNRQFTSQQVWVMTHEQPTQTPLHTPTLVPARQWDRKCTWDDHRAQSSHPCRSRHRSYKAGKWSPSHSTARIVPAGRKKKHDKTVTSHRNNSTWDPFERKKKGEEKKKSLEGSRAIDSCGGVVWVSVQWLQNESVHCTYKILRTCMSLKRSSTVFKTKLWIKMLIMLKIL